MSAVEPSDTDVGTQPAGLADMGLDSVSTMRPMSTQAVYRPSFDDNEANSVTSEPVEVEDH